MQKRILITGGSGLLALNWAQVVKDHMLVTLGLNQRSVSISGVDTRKINLESIDDFVHTLEEIDPHFVIHTVGLTSVEKCEIDSRLAEHINVKLASNVAKACMLLGVRLVHISTDQLFAGEESFISEEQLVATVNIYGKTKAEAENQVLSIYPQSLVIRTNFYGWGTGYRRSFSDVIIDGLRARKTLYLYRDIYFTPILIRTAVEVVHELLDKKACGIFNVVGNDRISKYDFGVLIAREFGLDSSKIYPALFQDTKSLADRPLDMSLSNHKIRSFLDMKISGTEIQISQLRQQEIDGYALELLKL
jgi:dTDP-4-dehydrorhamnose reductase